MKSLCLCDAIQPFKIEPLIVLLVHPREFMKTVGTVRIVSLSLPESMRIRGHGKDFDQDGTIANLIENPQHHPVVLFPGAKSLNLSTASDEVLLQQVPADKRLVIFVMDGTWSAAKNMIKKSARLSALPKISFSVNSTSLYEIRKQPDAFCLSTVEAVSALIENLKMRELCHPEPANGHLQMLKGFQKLIASQLEYESNPQHRQAKRFRKNKKSQPFTKTDSL